MKTEAPFQLDFTLDAKAAVSDAGDGALFIEGYASDFGLDRQDEAFEPGAFEQGMKSYMDGNPVLLFHHKYDQALGQVVEFAHKAQGLWVKARVDAPEPGTSLADVVRKIKTGTIKGFSVGGKFHRRKTAAGPRIHKADIMEISVTPFPVNPRTLFAVSQKAFDEETPDLGEIQARLDELSTTFDDLGAKADLSASGRAAAAKSGAAEPDGSFPIDNAKDLRDAIDDYGRAGAQPADRAHIISRATTLGLTHMLPAHWTSS